MFRTREAHWLHQTNFEFALEISSRNFCRVTPGSISHHVSRFHVVG
jgi:hypothetical protein